MIKGLDGLRGIAVLLVIISHISFWNRLGFDNNFTSIMMNGDFGVRLFFVLSGFLITFLLLNEKITKGSINLKTFWIRRFLRLMPVYYVAILFTFIIELIGLIRIPNCSYYYALTYTYNFVTPDCNWKGFSHFWSLAVEEHFYLLWPIFLHLSIRFSAIFILMLVCFFAWMSDLSFIFELTKGMSRWTYPAIVPIAIGTISAFLITFRSKYFEENSSLFFDFMLLLAFTLILSPFLAMEFQHNYKVILQSTGVALLLLYIFYNQESLLVKVLSFQPLITIGLMSYGLYIWQGVFTGNGSYRKFSWPPSVDVGIFLTFFVSIVSYYYLERPILKLKDKFR